jgi:hypothetical protein
VCKANRSRVLRPVKIEEKQAAAVSGIRTCILEEEASTRYLGGTHPENLWRMETSSLLTEGGAKNESCLLTVVLSETEDMCIVGTSAFGIVKKACHQQDHRHQG